MRKKLLFQSVSADIGGTGFSVIVCSSFFLLGAVCGSFLSVYIADPDHLYVFFTSFFSGISGSGDIAFSGVLLDCLRFLIADFIFSFSAFGVLFIPATAAFKGFLVSFSLAVFIRLFGISGLPVSMALFGVDAFLFSPVFIQASAISLNGSVFLVKTCFGKQRLENYYSKGFYFLFLLLVIICVLIAGLEFFSASLLGGGYLSQKLLTV